MVRWLLAALVALLVCPAAYARTGRPEIVVIVDDDVSAHSMGAYGEPEALNTPNFDALASGGQLYLNATSSATCSPTRRNIFYGETELQHAVGAALQVDEDIILPPMDRPNLVHSLQSRGYRVVLVGKFHVAPVTQSAPPAAGVVAMGWDDVRALMLENPRAVLPDAPGSPAPSGNHHRHWIETDWQTGIATVQTGYTTDVMTAAAASILQDADPRPLALFLMYSAPHRPMNPPPGQVGQCAPTIDSIDPACYGKAIEYIDAQIPAIVSNLDPAEDLLIKTSDNGRPQPFSPATEYCQSQNSKGHATPCGTRVPLLVWGNGVTPGVVSAVVDLTDIHDTLEELVGAPQTGPASHSFVSCFSDPTGCAPRQVAGSIRFKPNGLPLAMYGSSYQIYQIGLSTIVDGNLYGLFRWWDNEPGGNGPGPYTDKLLDLGPANVIDRTKRYAQVEVEPIGAAGMAYWRMRAEMLRQESQRAQLAPVPSSTLVPRVVLAGALAALGSMALRLRRLGAGAASR